MCRSVDNDFHRPGREKIEHQALSPTPLICGRFAAGSGRRLSLPASGLTRRTPINRACGEAPKAIFRPTRAFSRALRRRPNVAAMHQIRDAGNNLNRNGRYEAPEAPQPKIVTDRPRRAASRAWPGQPSRIARPARSPSGAAAARVPRSRCYASPWTLFCNSARYAPCRWRA